MSALIPIIYAFSGYIGGRMGQSAFHYCKYEFLRRRRKNILKKELRKSIAKLDYIEFKDIISKIKTYDNFYNKEMYIKIKFSLGFTDKVVDSLEHFENRFDKTKIDKDIILNNKIRNIVREYSISKETGIFDL